MRHAALLALLILLAGGCRQQDGAAERGREAIERARAAHGMELLDHATVSFLFRGDRFTAYRDGGRFEYTRQYTDSEERVVRDVLNNDGPSRTIEGVPIELSDPQRASIKSTVNSVVYFALLPYNLADEAVRPRHVGRDTVQGRVHDLVEVTFEQEGGGRDWEDRFLYWFDVESGLMSYMAYRFYTGKGGTRFRVATNWRTVEGVRFADYLNYVAVPDTFRLEAYPALLQKGRLNPVSDVVLDSVRVERRR